MGAACEIFLSQAALKIKTRQGRRPRVRCIEKGDKPRENVIIAGGGQLSLTDTFGDGKRLQQRNALGCANVPHLPLFSYLCV